MTTKEIPVLLLTGYLGSGKTTLVNHILANKQGIRFAVIVNDIGEVNIDADLIQKGGIVGKKDESLVALQNGCICCTLVGDFADALAKLIETYHLSQEEAARRIGKSQSAVANKLRLLRLPPDVLTLLRERGCTERHARALLRLEDPQDQTQAAAQVVERHLTVAQTEALVEAMLAQQQTARKKPTFLIRDVRLFLNTITRSLDLMRSAGVDAQCRRTDTDQEILLTIHIPRHPS